jgi:sugar transferase (PEP-CTERM/EpsH1 system associated)
VRILWVKSGGLLPPDTGGRIRSYSLLRELAHHSSVDLFLFYPEHEQDIHAQLKEICRQVTLMPLPIAPPKSRADYARYARNLFSLQPYAVAKYCRPAVKRALAQLLEREAYDVIVCDFLLTASVFPSRLRSPMVIFTHNVEAQIWQRHFEVSANPIWKAVSWREYKTMTWLEERQLRRADFVLTVSENDLEFFTGVIPREKLAAIPTGVDIDYFSPGAEAELPNSLVFTGSMDWLPNEDAIHFFAGEILPLIRREIPDVTLCVAGRSPSQGLLDLADREQSLHVTGSVPDIRPYMNRASVYIVPLRIGGGTRIKIFEAMAAGKAVVSTTLGAEGLPVQHGQNILLADRPDEFANHVIELLRDQNKRGALGKAARQLVAQNYSWRSVAQQLADILGRVILSSRSREFSATRLSGGYRARR